MKSLTCEMCGSTDIIKKDGVYVCQYCDTKYTVEEAKKMMIEGTVDVTGSTVKVDNTAFVEKYLANARRAKQKEDWEETEKYYNMVEQNDPTNIEAIFYSAYAKALLSLTDSDMYKRKAAFRVLQNSVSIVDDNFSMENEADEKMIVQQISRDIVSLCSSTYTYTRYGTGLLASSDSGDTILLFYNLNVEFFTTLTEIEKKYPENSPDTIYLIEREIVHKEAALSLRKRPDASSVALLNHIPSAQVFTEEIQKLHKKWNRLDSAHAVPELPDTSAKSSGGCYVATCVYGSYDCPQVWTLRRYRDDTLASTWYGRAFIRTYYAVSPTLVKWFGNTDWFKRMWKGKLDKMVRELNESGVADTPYNDR